MQPGLIHHNSTLNIFQNAFDRTIQENISVQIGAFERELMIFRMDHVGINILKIKNDFNACCFEDVLKGQRVPSWLTLFEFIY
jgi:hypothetical protein